jgi:hypothetical protein
MKAVNFQIGQKAIFSYDRNYMTNQQTRSHDGEIVTIKDSQWEAQGHTYITVENEFNAIYPVMIQELSVIIAETMKAIVFFNETSLNGKFQVMTTAELSGVGIQKYGSNNILTHKNEIYKGLNNYWVTESALSEIKKDNLTERTFF